MAKYVDGFVFVVPGDRVDEYRRLAEQGRDSWLRNGALSYYECIGDDLTTRDLGGGKPVEFTELTHAGPGDTVWFSFIIFESKQHRDDVNRKVIEEMNEKYKEAGQFSMPFEMHRFAYGGFRVAVEAESAESFVSSSEEYRHQGH